MRKGNFYLCYAFYAVLAFVLAALGQLTLCALLLGFVAVLERDEWTVRQCLQGFLLALAGSIFEGLRSLLMLFNFIPVLNVVVSGLLTLLAAGVSLLVLLFALSAIGQVSREQDASIPLISGLADKAMGILRGMGG